MYIIESKNNVYIFGWISFKLPITIFFKKNKYFRFLFAWFCLVVVWKQGNIFKNKIISTTIKLQITPKIWKQIKFT